MAGHVGVPVVLLSGATAACAELCDLIPSAVTVAVKQALGQGAAVALHPAEAREHLNRAAADLADAYRLVLLLVLLATVKPG